MSDLPCFASEIVLPNARNQRRAQRVRWIELLGGSDESLLWL
ncbi:MAG TPA: hypothetical protein VFM15_05480 [Gammaproteobacteria bacterium]|nr:hypothetical protein [Gammaproteobacteria bacterium]